MLNFCSFLLCIISAAIGMLIGVRCVHHMGALGGCVLRGKEPVLLVWLHACCKLPCLAHDGASDAMNA